MNVLTEQDLEFFHQNGYVVIPNAVPQENLDAAIAAIWEFLDADPNDSQTWYRPPLRRDGMVEIYQHQALWNNRQHPRVHGAFADIFGNEKLWVSMDRASMKPPPHPDHPEYDSKGFVHWDCDTSKLPRPFGVQGVLYLTDTTEDMGGFRCIPGFHKNLEEWIKTQPADRNPRAPDLTGLEVKPIPGKAGDLLIWDTLLAHGNGHNTSNRPRMAQYITMSPARDNEDARRQRIERWEKRQHTPLDPNAGDPRRWEEQHGKTAELTPLGRKLLGLNMW
ncbi:MAG TPA: phytanoyl-CoA dioxygenase family protein [Abditibacteriaceae bacterium]|jgi:hypothetical protein